MMLQELFNQKFLLLCCYSLFTDCTLVVQVEQMVM